MGKYTDDDIRNAAKITVKIAADYLGISPNILTLGMRNNLLPGRLLLQRPHLEPFRL